jgi:hypothetical protein
VTIIAMSHLGQLGRACLSVMMLPSVSGGSTTLSVTGTWPGRHGDESA